MIRLKDTIVSILKARGSNIRQLSMQIGMTRAGLDRALANESLRPGNLRDVCLVLDLSADELLGLKKPVTAKKTAQKQQTATKEKKSVTAAKGSK